MCSRKQRKTSGQGGGGRVAVAKKQVVTPKRKAAKRASDLDSEGEEDGVIDLSSPQVCSCHSLRAWLLQRMQALHTCPLQAGRK